MSGWIKVNGCDVYVENGKVARGTKWKGAQVSTVYPYRRTDQGWKNVSGELTPNALRLGMKRGTMRMM